MRETHEGRISVAEEKLRQLEKKLESIDTKLDDILALRQKGVGAFWLASSLLGTGFVGVFVSLIHWFRGDLP